MANRFDALLIEESNTNTSKKKQASMRADLNPKQVRNMMLYLQSIGMPASWDLAVAQVRQKQEQDQILAAKDAAEAKAKAEAEAVQAEAARLAAAAEAQAQKKADETLAAKRAELQERVRADKNYCPSKWTRSSLSTTPQEPLSDKGSWTVVTK